MVGCFGSWRLVEPSTAALGGPVLRKGKDIWQHEVMEMGKVLAEAVASGDAWQRKAETSADEMLKLQRDLSCMKDKVNGAESQLRAMGQKLVELNKELHRLQRDPTSLKPMDDSILAADLCTYARESFKATVKTLAEAAQVVLPTVEAAQRGLLAESPNMVTPASGIILVRKDMAAAELAPVRRPCAAVQVQQCIEMQKIIVPNIRVHYNDQLHFTKTGITFVITEGEAEQEIVLPNDQLLIDRDSFSRVILRGSSTGKGLAIEPCVGDIEKFSLWDNQRSCQETSYALKQALLAALLFGVPNSVTMALLRDCWMPFESIDPRKDLMCLKSRRYGQSLRALPHDSSLGQGGVTGVSVTDPGNEDLELGKGEYHNSGTHKLRLRMLGDLSADVDDKFDPRGCVIVRKTEVKLVEVEASSLKMLGGAARPYARWTPGHAANIAHHAATAAVPPKLFCGACPNQGPPRSAPWPPPGYTTVGLPDIPGVLQ